MKTVIYSSEMLAASREPPVQLLVLEGEVNQPFFESYMQLVLEGEVNQPFFESYMQLLL